MAVRGKNRHYQWKEISGRHWLETARRCGFSGMKSIIDEVIARTPEVVAQVTGQLPHQFPTSIAEPILTGTRDTARLLAEQMAKGS